MARGSAGFGAWGFSSALSPALGTPGFSISRLAEGVTGAGFSGVPGLTFTAISLGGAPGRRTDFSFSLTKGRFSFNSLTLISRIGSGGFRLCGISLTTGMRRVRSGLIFGPPMRTFSWRKGLSLTRTASGLPLTKASR